MFAHFWYVRNAFCYRSSRLGNAIEIKQFFAFSIAGKVRDTMHVAFWNILKEDLAGDPPRYEHLLQLIGEAKEVRFLI